MQKIIVIVGATGTKKTQLALKLAPLFNAEIINADAFQVYKELNIGVNKPTSVELQAVPHHLISCFSIHDEFDLKIYQDHCVACINEIAQRKHNIILCGGSNLYIDAVIKGFNLDKSLGRQQLSFFDDWKYTDIYQYVYDHDPVAAEKININNQKRIIRAAQIIYSTKQSKTAVEQEAHRFVYDCFIIETTLDRALLYPELNQRVENMLNKGWIEEVETLVSAQPKDQPLKAMDAIGYRQILCALTTRTPVLVEKIQQATRQLAKKQMTWCRNKYPHVHRFDHTKDDFSKLTHAVDSFLKTKTK